MLATEDIEDLFLSMRTAYGPQWKHGQGAVKVWRSALSRFPVEQIQKAANQSLHEYTNHPPTLPQFLALCRPPERPNTYLPAPRMTGSMVAGNRVLMAVIRNQGGVEDYTLRNLVALKNALVEEHGAEKPTLALIDSLTDELTALADNHDAGKKQEERERARRTFCRKQGIKYEAAA